MVAIVITTALSEHCLSARKCLPTCSDYYFSLSLLTEIKNVPALIITVLYTVVCAVNRHCINNTVRPAFCINE